MKICIPIREKNLQQAGNKVKKALKIVKNLIIFGKRPKIFFEIWLDDIWNVGADNIKNLIKFCKETVIAVCRGKIERGNFKGSEKERIEVLKKAVLAGAKAVDCGIETDKKLIYGLKNICKQHGAKLIISKHIWDKTPEISKLLKIYKNAKALGADIVKIATQAKNWSDNVVLFELVSKIAESGGKIIAVGIGEKGKISRIGCPLLGSYLTYVALDKKSRTADGQLTLSFFNNFQLSIFNLQ